MELVNISLTRGDRPLFQGLSLRLSEARIGLIGANGSGKSSLLRLMKGLLTPAAGSVRSDGPVGLVFQNPDHQLLFPTVMEELCFGLIEQGKAPSLAKAAVLELLARYHCSGLSEKATHELSDGQKQLVCIFAVLADGASTILFDEPCASLDLPTTQTVTRLIQSLPQQVILASHDFGLFKNFDRVIWINDGSIQMDGPPNVVLPAYALAHTVPDVREEDGTASL